jgi:hypothetical protein
MKVEAYKCDSCKVIYDDIEEIVGILPQPDLFDEMEGYKSTHLLAKTKVHYCLECWRTKVLIPAGNMADRKKDEETYKKLLKELAYIFKKGVLVKTFTQKV